MVAFFYSPYWCTYTCCCNGAALPSPFSMQSPLPLVNAHADELVEFLLHILGSAEAEMNLKDSSALVRAEQGRALEGRAACW